MNPQEAFLDLLIAAMKDAAGEQKMTQIKATIESPKSGILKFVRIVVMPEELEYNWPTDAPLGTEKKGK